jgi:hypothetical protein
MERNFLRCATGARCWRQPAGIYCSLRPTRGGRIVGENCIRSISNCQSKENSPEALIVALIGDELALSFDDDGKMIEAIDTLRHPACAFQAQSRDVKSTKPVAVYVVPQLQTPANVRTASLAAQLPAAGMRKAAVPGNDFAIVFATTRTPIAWDPNERPDTLKVYYAGSELIMAVDGDVEKMFKDVGISQMPSCQFEVENKNSNPSQAASVYIVPNGQASASTPV